MTDEELDRARAARAVMLSYEQPQGGDSAPIIAARLAREGWTPPDPLEADLGAVLREYGYQSWAGDKSSSGYQMVRAVMERGIEIGRNA